MTFDGGLTPRGPVRGHTQKKVCHGISSYAVGLILMKLSENDPLVVLLVIQNFDGGLMNRVPIRSHILKKALNHIFS